MNSIGKELPAFPCPIKKNSKRNLLITTTTGRRVMRGWSIPLNRSEVTLSLPLVIVIILLQMIPTPPLTRRVIVPNPALLMLSNLAWLENQLAKTKAKHKFFFAHAPYYKIVGDQSSQTTSFTELWSILDNYHVDLFGCGHEHLYSRKSIDSSIAPVPQWRPPFQWKNNVTQLLTGTCGAPIDDGTLVVDRSTWHVFNDFNAPNNYYFSVIDINGSKVNVTSYGVEPIVYTDGDPVPPFKVIDRFSIPSDISARDLFAALTVRINRSMP